MVRFCPLNKVVGPLPNVLKKRTYQWGDATITYYSNWDGLHGRVINGVTWRAHFFEWPKNSWVSLGVNFLPQNKRSSFTLLLAGFSGPLWTPCISGKQLFPGCFFWLSSSGLKTSRSPITLSPIIMDVENAPQWKETNIGGTHFPWLSMWWFQIFFIFIPIWGRWILFWLFFRWVGSTTKPVMGRRVRVNQTILFITSSRCCWAFHRGRQVSQSQSCGGVRHDGDLGTEDRRVGLAGMRVPMLSKVFVGDEIWIPQLCGDYFMSHEIKDPVIKQPGFNFLLTVAHMRSMTMQGRFFSLFPNFS